MHDSVNKRSDKIRKKVSWDCRDNIGVDTTHCFSRGPVFGTQYPCLAVQLPVTPV